MSSGVKRDGTAPVQRRREPPGRSAIASAARTLFAERGYSGTTVEAIAHAAGYATQTVYFHFGSKAAIVRYLTEQMKAEAVSPSFDRSLQATDAAGRLDECARIVRDVGERWGDLYPLLRAAGLTDPALAALLNELESGRLYGSRMVAEHLERDGSLRDGLDARRATDIMWALNSEDTYRRLVVECGWTHDQFEAWLSACLKRELLRRP